jgi:hypothetical protein
VDACVLLSYVDGDADRMPEIEELLRRGSADELELLTSVLSHVEVAEDVRIVVELRRRSPMS